MVLHRELLHQEIRLGLQEHGKGTSTPKVQADGLELLVTAADDIKHKRAVGDNLSQIAKHVCHALEFPAVIGD